MSAFMLSKNHLNALVTAFIYLGDSYVSAPFQKEGEVGYSSCTMRVWGDSRNMFVSANGTPSEMLYILAKANYDSVIARYGEKCGEKEPLREEWIFELYIPFYTVTCGSFTIEQLGQIAKAVECFEYQACEVENFDTTAAARFCRAIKSAVFEQLPGYSTAAWAI